MKKNIILIIALSILLTGCWDAVEPEKLGLVTLMGVDSSNNSQLKVVIMENTCQKKDSGGQGGGSAGKPSFKMHEATAASIFDAMQKITASDFRRTYMAHATAVILSETLVKSTGIGPLIDYFERNPEVRRNTWLLICKSDQFDRIFSTSTTVEPSTDAGKVIREIIKNKPQNSFLTANNLGDFLNLFWETGSEPYTSEITLVDINSAKANQTEGKDSNKISSIDFYIENTAVFKKEKMVGWLDNYESIGLQWGRGGIKGGSISVKYEDKDVSLKILKADLDVKPAIIDGKMSVNINIKVVSNLAESQANLDYEDQEVIKKIQDLQIKEIKKQVNAALKKTKEMNSDVFGFGNLFFSNYPAYWKQVGTNWYDYYQNIDVNIDVDSTVNNIGLVRRSQGINSR